MRLYTVLKSSDMVSPTLYTVLPFLRSQIAINIPERHRLQQGVVTPENVGTIMWIQVNSGRDQ